jgi:hypothetical protein
VRRPRKTWFVLVLALAACVLPAAAFAQRKATPKESKQMWSAVLKKGENCKERRGQISTAVTPGFKFGTVTIADAHCGNGQFVLRKRRASGAKWKIVGAGSDWGAPERCADDLAKIPRPVLEDFFGAGYCSGY